MARDTFRDALDRLYQLPLSEFTNARDELAKQDASRRAEIRRLPKPNVAAWAVNQLYWRERGAYEALVVSSERLRKAHMASLTGKTADVPAAEAAHANARRSAADRVRKMLEEAGDAGSPATMTAIGETLDALPTADPAGRLVRPLKPAGFETLTGLLKGKKIAVKTADVLLFKPSAPDRRKEERERKAKLAKERELKRLNARVEQARAALAQAKKELEDAESR